MTMRRRADDKDSLRVRKSKRTYLKQLTQVILFAESS